MSSVLILSDSHGLSDEITQIKERHQVDMMIHCGDSELAYNASNLKEFVKVKGNCDFDSRFLNDQMAETGGLSFFATHGHLYQVKRNLMALSYKAEEVNADIVCFGHTHVAGAEKIGDTLFINPGSIRLPRNRPEKSYVIVKWTDRSDVTVCFYAIDGNEIVDLTYHTSI